MNEWTVYLHTADPDEESSNQMVDKTDFEDQVPAMDNNLTASPDYGRATNMQLKPWQQGRTSVQWDLPAPPVVPMPRFMPSQEQIEIIKRTVAADLTDDEFTVFLEVAKRTGLNPIAKQIYAIVRKGRMTIQTSIDGFRLIAERTGHYAGQLGPYWYDIETGTWSDVWVKDELPAAAKVGILRRDFQEPLWSTARFKSFNQKQNLWISMPEHMIAKVAEALGLRRAFPQELSGLYTDDEMDQADREEQVAVVEHRPRPQVKPLTPEVQQDAMARVRALADRAQDARRIEADTDPGAFIIPGTGAHAGKRLDMLSAEVVHWLTENSKNPHLKQAAIALEHAREEAAAAAATEE